MSVKTLRIAIAALVLVAPLELAAQQRVIIRSVKQLAMDADVRSHVENYWFYSGANVVYAQCGKALGISDEQQQYLRDKFTLTSKQYVAAYLNAYVSRVHAPPPKALGEDVVKTVTAQQQAAVNSMALVIRQRGCNNGSLRQIAKYLEQLRQQELTASKVEPLPPAY